MFVHVDGGMELKLANREFAPVDTMWRYMHKYGDDVLRVDMYIDVPTREEALGWLLPNGAEPTPENEPHEPPEYRAIPAVVLLPRRPKNTVPSPLVAIESLLTDSAIHDSAA